MDAKKYLTMSMDDLANEVSETKAKLSALQKLLAVRRQMGERTTKQLKASEKAKKKAPEKEKSDNVFTQA